MALKRKRYDEDFKKNAVKLSYASPKTVSEIAQDLYHRTCCTDGVKYRKSTKYSAKKKE